MKKTTSHSGLDPESMRLNFWDNLPKPFFCLAPMEDVTDVVFRQVVARAAKPDVFFTEFMNVSGFCHPKGRESVARRLQTSPTDIPIVAQIWGSDPEKFSLTAAELSKMGFAGIDINMGCPDKAVVKSGGGSALIKTPKLAVDIIQKVKKKSSLPVSVKTRLGYSSVDEWRSWLTILFKQDLSALTVHLRTKKEMSKVSAHYELIQEIIKLRDTIAPNTKLVINGDIISVLQGQSLYGKYPGIDGIMIGRGVFANPFCFEKMSLEHSKSELVDLLKYHLDLFKNHTTTHFSELGTVPNLKKDVMKYEPLKKYFKIYVNGFPGAKELRAELMETKNAEEAQDILNGLDPWDKPMAMSETSPE